MAKSQKKLVFNFYLSMQHWILLALPMETKWRSERASWWVTSGTSLGSWNTCTSWSTSSASRTWPRRTSAAWTPRWSSSCLPTRGTNCPGTCRPWGTSRTMPWKMSMAPQAFYKISGMRMILKIVIEVFFTELTNLVITW